jgi:hypothetical protein
MFLDNFFCFFLTKFIVLVNVKLKFSKFSFLFPQTTLKFTSDFNLIYFLYLDIKKNKIRIKDD